MKKLFTFLLLSCTTCLWAQPIQPDASGFSLPENPNLPTEIDGFAGVEPWGHVETSTSAFEWSVYRIFFDTEKALVPFPHRPTIVQLNGTLNASASLQGVQYIFHGFYPPNPPVFPEPGSPPQWFQNMLKQCSQPPFILLSKHVFQAKNGDWICEFTTQNIQSSYVVRGYAVTTANNQYFLECVKPLHAADDFSFFISNFSIQCACGK